MSKWLKEKTHFTISRGLNADELDVKEKKSPSKGDGQIDDAVFGVIDLEKNHGPNFRGVGAGGAFVLMTKANFGLGVLAIPTVFAIMGIVPGILLIVGIEIMLACKSPIPPLRDTRTD